MRQIVSALIEKNSGLSGKHINGMDEEAYQAIMAYDWPGNILELDAVIRRAVHIARGDRICKEDLFIDPPAAIGKATFNLLKLEQIRKFFSQPLFPGCCTVEHSPSYSADYLSRVLRQYNSVGQYSTYSGLWILGTGICTLHPPGGQGLVRDLSYRRHERPDQQEIRPRAEGAGVYQ
jgi:transcriptional regulator with GAF, ATPase, and Fis domain